MVNEQVLEQLVRFHGHMCAGLALGVRAAEAALRVLGEDAAPDDLIVAVETNTCSVDAIQALTGATFGNGKLHYRDYAKNAYTFWRSGRRNGVRVAALPDDRRATAPGFWDTFERIQRGTATAEERAEFFVLQQERSQRILGVPEDELFDVEEVPDLPPVRPLITRPVLCSQCEEPAMRVEEHSGTWVCGACAQRRGLTTGSR